MDSCNGYSDDYDPRSSCWICDTGMSKDVEGSAEGAVYCAYMVGVCMRCVEEHNIKLPSRDSIPVCRGCNHAAVSFGTGIYTKGKDDQGDEDDGRDVAIKEKIVFSRESGQKSYYSYTVFSTFVGGSDLCYYCDDTPHEGDEECFHCGMCGCDGDCGMWYGVGIPPNPLDTYWDED